MNTTTLASGKSLSAKTLGIAGAAAVIVLAIIGWTAGWFGGADPAQQAAPAPAVEQSTTPAPAPAQTGSGQPNTTAPAQ
jgi:hypothetical protein